MYMKCLCKENMTTTDTIMYIIHGVVCENG